VTLRVAIATSTACFGALPAFAAVPSAAEFIDAVRMACPDKRGAITHVSCKGVGRGEPTEAVCTYRFGGKAKMKTDKTYVAIDGRGWRLIDDAGYCLN
jgi:hypothetical protein